MREAPSTYGSGIAEVEVLPAALLDIGVRYMQDLKKKALDVSQTLQKAGIPHAVIGGLALAAHLARANPLAERNTQDLDILLNKADLERAKIAMAPLGYRYRRVLRLHAFMPQKRGAHFVEGVHIIWAGEKVRPEYLHATPTLPPVSSTRIDGEIYYLQLLDLVVMKLTSFRHKDITHIQDLLYWKLLTPAIQRKLPPDLLLRLEDIKRDTVRESG